MCRGRGICIMVGSAEGAGEESRKSPHSSRKNSLKARKPALRGPKSVQNGGVMELWFSVITVTMKPLAGECRLGKYNFSIVLVVLL